MSAINTNVLWIVPRDWCNLHGEQDFYGQAGERLVHLPLRMQAGLPGDAIRTERCGPSGMEDT